MEIYIETQLLNIAYSVILGLIFGALYDIIRIVHILCNIASYSGENVGMKRGKIAFAIFFICDAVYMVAVTALYSLFTYWANNGTFRLFLFVSACIGFLLYYFTLGRVVMFFSEAVARFLRLIFKYAIVIPLRFIVKTVKKCALFVYGHTFKKFFRAVKRMHALIINSGIQKSVVRDIRFDLEKRGNVK